MITVEAYTGIPGVFTTTEDALEEIKNTYGFWEWQAICDVAHLSPQGAVVDIEGPLGELYYDPELQTFIFRVAATRAVETYADVEIGYTEEGEPIYEVQVVTREEEYEKLRAVSYLKQEDEDA